MMVNSVGGSYQYSNTLNLLRLSGADRPAPFQPVEPVKRVSKASSSPDDYKDIREFLKTYQSKLSGLESAAARLTEGGKNVFQDYQAGDTKESAASADAVRGVESDAVQGQDAVSENGTTETLKSDSNRTSLDYGRNETELKGTGETGTYTGIENDTVISAVDDLVKGYNDVTSFLEKNEARGAGTSAHLRSFKRGMADEKTLNTLGISYNKDGKMELNKETLKSALETDYEGVKSLVGGQFGIAEKASSRADAALSDSVQRIVSNDLKPTVDSLQNDSTSASFQYFSSFARNGPYNLTNYYTVGLILNTIV